MIKRFEISFDAEDAGDLKDVLEWASASVDAELINSLPVGMVMDIDAVLTVRRVS